MIFSQFSQPLAPKGLLEIQMHEIIIYLSIYSFDDEQSSIKEVKSSR